MYSKGGRGQGYHGGDGNWQGGRKKNKGMGRGGQRHHPPGLSGREIGMWYKARSLEKKRVEEQQQRQDVDMSEEHEKYLTKMLEEFSKAPSFDPSGNFREHSFENDQEFSLPKPLLNDPETNEWLKNDLNMKVKQNKTYIQMAEFRKKLPAFEMKQEIVNLISNNQVVVISGETGCGKTTQVPQFILDNAIMNNRGSTCRIVCTQPRRISAISIAERVAAERGETVGGDGSVGYQIRLESKQPRDQGSIIFCTTGVILRWLISDPDFSRTSHVIIDEIHERSLDSDFLLIVIRDILPRRPDLKIILMSATLNADMFSQYFSNCPRLNIPGYTFPVEQHFLEEIIKLINYKCSTSSKRKFYRGRDEALRRKEEKWKEFLNLLQTREKDFATVLCLENMDFDKIDYCLVEQLLVHICLKMQEGAILVFLPGWQDISTMNDTLKKNPFFSSDKYRILPLHSLLPTVNQRQIFERPPNGVRKIVLSTSLAETSITIDDVVFVVDCGKTKEKNFDVDKQLSTLLPLWISKASCKQRRGRAGRVQKGFCFHLFTEFHYEEMVDYQLPEMLRTPLEETCLQVKSLKLGMVEPFLTKALQAPSEKAIKQALSALRQLNAFDQHENLTSLGYHLSRLPVHPRIGKIILFAAIMSCLDPVLTIASAMGFKNPFVLPLNKEKEADKCRQKFARETQSDHLTLYHAFQEWESANKFGSGYQFCWDNFLSNSILQMIKNMKTQFAELLCRSGFISSNDPKQETANRNSHNEALIKAVLSSGFYPNVIFVSHSVFSFKPPRLSIQQDGRLVKVEHHLKSVNASQSFFQSNWLIYFEKVKSTKIFIHDSSPVSPYSLLFFCGDVSNAVDENEEIIVVDQWIKFNCRKSVAILVQKLREEFEKFLEQRIRNPELPLNMHDQRKRDRETILITTIIDLITSQ